jgi:general secretion pathway protein M
MSALENMRGRAVALLLLLGAIMLVWFGAAHPYLEALSNTRHRLEAASAQLQIYQRAVARGKVAHAGKNDALDALLLPGESAAAAAAYLQQRMGEIAADSGALLLSFELLPVTNTDDAPLKAAMGRIRVTANTQSLRALLHAVESHRPLLLLDNLFVRARSDQDSVPGGHLDVQMDVSGFRRAAE